MLFLDQSCFRFKISYSFVSFISLDIVWSESSLVSVLHLKRFLLFDSSSREPPGLERPQEPSGAAGPAGGQTSAGGRGPAGQSREPETASSHVSDLKREHYEKTIWDQKDADHVELKGQTVLYRFVKECQLNVKRKVVLFSDLPKLSAVDVWYQMPSCFLFLLSVEISRCTVSGSGWHHGHKPECALVLSVLDNSCCLKLCLHFMHRL